MLGAYDAEGSAEVDDGSALPISLLLGIPETDGTVLELGTNDEDGLLLVLINVGSALSLGLPLMLGIVLGLFEAEGDSDKADGNALCVSIELGMLESDGAVLELGLSEADDGLSLVFASDGIKLG